MLISQSSQIDLVETKIRIKALKANCVPNFPKAETQGHETVPTESRQRQNTKVTL